MKNLLKICLLAVLLPLAGCVGHQPYDMQYGAWTNYNPHYEHGGGYRWSNEPLSYYGPGPSPAYYDGYPPQSYGPPPPRHCACDGN